MRCLLSGYQPEVALGGGTEVSSPCLHWAVGWGPSGQTGTPGSYLGSKGGREGFQVIRSFDL